MPIRHISDTARWVAMYRAMESERPDAHFRDPYARRLAGPEGEQILKSMPKGKALSWPLVVRTAVMDEIILRLVGSGQADAVVNLAAGLDARPYRMALPRDLPWFDVDYADTIRYKREQLDGEAARCRLEFVELDLREPEGRRAFFARVGGSARRALVITEGLLIYLSEDEVAGFARDLDAEPGLRWWLTDLASPKLLKMMEKTWGAALEAGGAPFRFGPAANTAFFAPYGWSEAEWRSTFEESLRLKRTMPFARLWRLLGMLSPQPKRAEVHRMAGIALLERTPGQ